MMIMSCKYFIFPNNLNKKYDISLSGLVQQPREKVSSGFWAELIPNYQQKDIT